ncbi:hypothetical protein D7D81_10025 [Halocella sp. SP3-1]|nr:hypothetical protein D7D81_10025 [Halocella sp. SP3-1]
MKIYVTAKDQPTLRDIIFVMIFAANGLGVGWAKILPTLGLIFADYYVRDDNVVNLRNVI